MNNLTKIIGLVAVIAIAISAIAIGMSLNTNQQTSKLNAQLNPTPIPTEKPTPTPTPIITPTPKPTPEPLGYNLEVLMNSSINPFNNYAFFTVVNNSTVTINSITIVSHSGDNTFNDTFGIFGELLPNSSVWEQEYTGFPNPNNPNAECSISYYTVIGYSAPSTPTATPQLTAEPQPAQQQTATPTQPSTTPTPTPTPPLSISFSQKSSSKVILLTFNTMVNSCPNILDVTVNGVDCSTSLSGQSGNVQYLSYNWQSGESYTIKVTTSTNQILSITATAP